MTPMIPPTTSYLEAKESLKGKFALLDSLAQAPFPQCRTRDQATVCDRAETAYPPPTKNRAQVLSAFTVPAGDARVKRYGQMEVAPGEVLTHVPDVDGGQETHMITEGELLFTVADEVFHMHPGQVITFPCNVPHKAENPGGVKAVTLFVVSRLEH